MSSVLTSFAFTSSTDFPCIFTVVSSFSGMFAFSFAA
jgi:hypothetical protein